MDNTTMSKATRYLIITVNTLFIGVCILFNFSLVVGFCLSIMATSAILIKNGFSRHHLFNIVIKGIKDCLRILFIILLIGGLISIWMASGAVPTMIYYGLNYIRGTNFLFISFIISAVTSVIMGTPLGTISTVGIAILAIGRGASIPVSVLLGAVISGAFVGDKISPVSGLMNLTIKTCGSTYKECSKHILNTLIPIFASCAIFYYVIGLNYKSNIASSIMDTYQANMLNSFYISPILLLLPVSIITLSIAGVNILFNMSIGIALGTFISMFFQNMSIIDVIKVVFSGYRASTGTAELDAILVGGGVVPMLELIVIIAGAVALSSLLEGTNTINPIIEEMLSNVSTKGELVKRTTLLSSFLTLITTDQTVGIIILGKVMQRKYEELEISKSVLTRTIIDSGVSIPPLIPWNITAIIITSITGIAASEYGIYAVLCYISPVWTVLVGYLEKKQNRKPIKSF